MTVPESDTTEQPAADPWDTLIAVCDLLDVHAQWQAEQDEAQEGSQGADMNCPA